MNFEKKIVECCWDSFNVRAALKKFQIKLHLVITSRFHIAIEINSYELFNKQYSAFRIHIVCTFQLEICELRR